MRVSRPTAAKPDIRRVHGRIGGGIGAKLCVLTRGDLSASAAVLTECAEALTVRLVVHADGILFVGARGSLTLALTGQPT